MSYTSISQATRDADLIARVEAATADESWTGANSETFFGKQVQTAPAYGAQVMIWPVAIDTEAAYESALAANNPAPGLDPAVITDQAILSAVQAHWPPDPTGG